MKPKCRATSQQLLPRASTSQRLSKPIQGTSWCLTVTKMFCSCSTLLCLRLCSSALGVEPFSADRKTAVPATRVGGLMKTASRKVVSSMASSRSLSESCLRPCFQVSIRVNMPMPMSSGNQPPAAIFSRLDARKVTSIRKKMPVAATHSASGYFQP